MGLKGPMRDPLSRRGVREMPDWKPEAPETPEAPGWLTQNGQGIFNSLVANLIEAKVPIKKVDAHAIAMAAMCIAEVERWSLLAEELDSPEMRVQCGQMVARNQRDAQQWLMVIGATPKGRAQMGLRGQQTEKKAGAVASILQRRNAG